MKLKMVKVVINVMCILTQKIGKEGIHIQNSSHYYSCRLWGYAQLLCLWWKHYLRCYCVSHSNSMLPAWNCSWREYLHHRSQDAPDSQLYIYQHVIGYFYVSVSSTRWWTSRTRASQILESPAEAFKILMSSLTPDRMPATMGRDPSLNIFLKSSGDFNGQFEHLKL